MASSPRVSVILPAHNEEGNLAEVLSRCRGALSDRPGGFELVVVDDGSDDGTLAIAHQEAAADDAVRVVSHRRRRGLTQALLSGLAASRGEILVLMCADLQSDPLVDLPKLLEPLETDADVALGWRQNRTDGKEVVSSVYHLLSRWLFGASFHDMNWVKAFRREILRGLKLRSDWHRYLAVLAHAQGFRIVEVPLACHPRRWGRSKFKGGRVVPGFLDLLVVKFHVSFIDRPMFLFGSLGLGLVGVAGAIGLYGILRYILERWVWPVPGGYKPLGVVYMAFLSCLVGGLLLFCFGLVAEFLVTIREEMRELREGRGPPPAA